jgi:hypothetical protein|tara:strand:- start:109 stop:543 length:435 start_codon:yes stop_codon:yes gene_type:complete
MNYFSHLIRIGNMKDVNATSGSIMGRAGNADQEYIDYIDACDTAGAYHPERDRSLGGTPLVGNSAMINTVDIILEAAQISRDVGVSLNVSIGDLTIIAYYKMLADNAALKAFKAKYHLDITPYGWDAVMKGAERLHSEGLLSKS